MRVVVDFQVGGREGFGDLPGVSQYIDREGEMVEKGEKDIPLYAKRLPLVFVRPLLTLDAVVPEEVIVCGASKRGMVNLT